MRLHKENTSIYEPFYKSLQDYDESSDDYNGVQFGNKNSGKSNLNLLEKYSHMFQNLMTFESEIRKFSEPEEITNKLTLSIKRILPVKELALLLFDESALNLKSVNQGGSEIEERMSHYYKEGILNIVFESGKAMILPELTSYNSNGSKLNYVVFPFYEDQKKKGLLCILSSIIHRNFSNFDKQIISTLLNISLTKIDKVLLRKKLNHTIEDLQTYQAKLSNDFRLAAIGELTEGILEDISTPLQVIMTQADLLEYDDADNLELKKIKQQVKKINSSINRLVKFSSLNQKNIKIQPCNLNKVIVDYHNIVKSTLESINLEFVLDFDDKIPSVLSHPNYIFQLLTNLLGLIKNNSKGSGGIVIQTRYKDDNIMLKLISTSSLGEYSQKNEDQKAPDLTHRIIENLMKKHEGNFDIENFEESGSVISLRFPLRRKLRK